MICPRCESSFYRKAGKSNCLQRYNCKKCNYYYTVCRKSTAKSLSIKRYALNMYLEGLGFRQIARVLTVSHTSVYRWINKISANVSLPRSEGSVDVV
jgi:transposase-like protein